MMGIVSEAVQLEWLARCCVKTELVCRGFILKGYDVHTVAIVLLCCKHGLSFPQIATDQMQHWLYWGTCFFGLYL